MAYIEFANVEVAYNRHVIALRTLDLRIEKGALIFLIGPTGSGKSTILKLISRQIKATGGVVSLDGQDLGELRNSEVPKLRRKLGIVPQDFALLLQKKAWENIAYALRAVGKSRHEARRSVGAILESVNMGHRADSFPQQLSGGEQQRLAIARALINAPEVILADEPTGNLDPERSREVLEVLLRLNREGVTVIIATHDYSILEGTGARVIRLEQGKVISDEVLENV